MRRILWACFCALSLPAIAQNTVADGTLVAPTENIIVFSAPPNAVFQRSPQAQGVLAPQNGGLALYPLAQGEGPGAFVIGEPQAQMGRTVQVGSQVEVWQRDHMERWVQLTDPATGTPLGWAQWGDPAKPRAHFRVQQ